MARLEKENRILRDLRRLDLIKKYGPGSESLSLEQLELLELEPGVKDAEVAAEAQREPIPAAAKKERQHPGRQELPGHLERVEQIIPCTSEQCVCGICGQEKQVIGYEASEVLEVEPAKYFVQVTKREKRACKGCEEGGVSCAPLPERIIEKGLGSDRVVIDAVINKYSFHLPLYRQSVILERESGLHLSRATLNGWMMRVGEMLIPIVRAMGQELLAGNYIQADETPVPVQMHDGRGKTTRPIYGNTAGREVRRSSSSGLAGTGKGLNSFWETLKESSKAMDTLPTTRWVAPKSSMRRVGRIISSAVLSGARSMKSVSA